MSSTPEVRHFDYVNAGYDQVCAVLRRDALPVCRAATKTAAARAASLASELHVNIAGFEIGTDIAIRLIEVGERPSDLKSPRTTTFALEWEAARRPRLFPFCARRSGGRLTADPDRDAARAVEPLRPALARSEWRSNALVGHRIADAAVHRFLNEVAAHLRSTLRHVVHCRPR